MAAGGLAAAEPAEPPVTPGGYVDRVEWAKWGDLSSLRVYPTPAARTAAGEIGTTEQADAAWHEVLAHAPEADMPGMYEQFLCHWQLAEFAQPGKTSWNLEPWRPQVDSLVMLETGCNPGGTEEPF
ncbi:DUF2599 domain-containing protein [Mycolicibacterium thermoresistibile]